MSTEKLISRVVEIATRAIGPAAGDYDRRGEWPEISVRELARAGLLGLTVPNSAGGLAVGPSEFVAVTEEISAACASTAMIFVMHICATEVLKQSPLPNKNGLLGNIARGEHITTLAFSERGSRSHFWSPMSQARAEDGIHVLNCDKSWVTSAGYADSYVVSTISVRAAGPTDSTLYYVRRQTPGLTVAGPWNGLGMRANASAPMRLENSRVSSDARLSAEGDGFNVMLGVVLPWFQLGSAAVANGIGRAALNAAAGHLTSSHFEHLGESLASLPTLRAKLARARVALDGARALTAAAACSVENPDEGTTLKVLEVKASACETALEVTDAAMRLCGGAAFSHHLPIERYFRDARAGAVMAPTTDVLYEFIGRSLLGLPLF